MAGIVKDVTTSEFAREVVERSHEVPVVVDFWAAWCGPCRVLGPTLERLADEAAGGWELAKVDVDSNQQLAMQFGVQGIPTVLGFRDGKPVARFTGAVPEAQVRAFLEGLVPSELDQEAARAERLAEEGDEAGAERGFRSVLAADPSHERAGVGLAALLIERGEASEALDVLAGLAPTEAVRRLQAEARLTPEADLAELEARAEGGAPSDLLALAKALAADGRTGEALDRLLDLVAMRDGAASDEARRVMLDLFEVLGPEHPLALDYRRKLASALF